MGLLEDFRKVYDAALFAVKWAEYGDRLDAGIDAVLKPWVRERIARWEHSMMWCDNDGDVAHAVDGLTAIAPLYAELRRELAADVIGLHRPEAPWRAIGRIRSELPGAERPVAVRARSRVHHRHEHYVLCRNEPDSMSDGLQTWEFRVLSAHPGEADVARVFPLTLQPATHDRYATVRDLGELARNRVWYEEMWFAFAATGRDVRETPAGED
ncbi:hypothetical protein [Embleya sp. NPDC005971]|uniref:hypothetical protein n=1 Tax=Embleya sp. NPDC005971 TaxID=3156724 RepID=UPI0033DD6120